MAIIHAKAKKWGDSIAVIIPSAVVNEKEIKVGDKLSLSVSKSHDIKEVYGILKEDK